MPMRQGTWTGRIRASRPLYADLKGLPPTLIQIGSAETLLDDAVRFAAAAGEADVPGDPRNLAAHDPRLAALERAPRAWPARASPHTGAFFKEHL